MSGTTLDPEDFPVKITDVAGKGLSAAPESARLALEVGQAANHMRVAMHLARAHMEASTELKATAVWTLVTSYLFFISANALHVFLQIFDRPVPGTNRKEFDEDMVKQYLSPGDVAALKQAYDTHRFNDGTVGFIRNKLTAHIDEHQINKWIAYRATEGMNIDWVVADGPTHEGWVSLAAQEMSLHIAATGRDGDLANTDAAGFEKMVTDVMAVHQEVIVIADHLEVELLRVMGLSVETAKGAPLSWTGLPGGA